MRCLAFALLLLIMTCSEASIARPSGPDTSLITVEYETLAQGDYADYDNEGGNIIIRSDDDYAAFWQALNGSRSPVPERPSVDFSSETVVAVMMGLRSTGGASITVGEVTFKEGVVTVKSVVTASGYGCAVTTALTSPYYVIKVNTTASDFAFENAVVNEPPCK